MHLERVDPSVVGSAELESIDRVLTLAYRVPNLMSRVLRWFAVQPDGWVIARTARSVDGPIIACGGFIAYPDAGFGWIGLIATDPESERHGCGRAITTWCVDELRDRGCAAVLDGSASGAPLYARMGFVDCGFSAVYRHEPSLQHPALPGGAAGVSSLEIVPISDAMFPSVFEFDRLAFGADRSRLLRYLIQTYGRDRFLVASDSTCCAGYVCAQDNTIGPLVAHDGAIADSLLTRALGLPWAIAPAIRIGPEGQLDAHTPHPLLVSHGFRLERVLRRQHLGVDRLPGDRRQLVAMASFGEG